MLVADFLERNRDLYPNDMAVTVFGGPRLTHADVYSRAARLAAWLLQSGVRRGDRVGLMAENGLAYFDVYFAASLIGASAVPLSTRLAPTEVAYVVKDAEPRIVFAGETFVDSVREAAGAASVVNIDAPEYADCFDVEPTPSEWTVDAEDIGLIIYTSGTTGRPKGVCLSQRALMFNAVATAASQGMRHSDVFLSATPLYHAATGGRVFTMLVDGQGHVVLTRFTAADVFRAIEDFRVTTTLLVPVQLRRILDSPEFPTADLSSLRLLLYGAAATEEQLILRAHRSLPCGIQQGYGLTECLTNITALVPEDHVLAEIRPSLLSSCGRVAVGSRVELRGDDGTAVARGEVGEIWVRSDRMMSGYFRRPDETEEVMRNGWLKTGDLAREDEDGYLYVVGRSKDMLISGGVNVYPSEIELYLQTHSAIREAAVVGLPDAEWGEVPVAFIITEPGQSLTYDDLVAFCEGNLSRIKIPRQVSWMDGDFERTDTGKVRKDPLRQQAIARWGAGVSTPGTP